MGTRIFQLMEFPFLFGGTFIEGGTSSPTKNSSHHFPSFSEGLSLRERLSVALRVNTCQFPFLFGGTFIEGVDITLSQDFVITFPFLFGGTFIEGQTGPVTPKLLKNFPSFSEGLSLRANISNVLLSAAADFPSFSEGLSLRDGGKTRNQTRG